MPPEDEKSQSKSKVRSGEKEKEMLRMKLKLAFALNKMKEKNKVGSTTKMDKTCEGGEKQSSGGLFSDIRVKKDKRSIIIDDNQQSHSHSSSSRSQHSKNKIEKASQRRKDVSSPIIIAAAEEIGASSNRPNARPCPLSKKRYMEEIDEVKVAAPEVAVRTSISAETETLKFASAYASPSDSLKIVQQSESPKKRMATPCPLSKKRKLAEEPEVAIKTSTVAENAKISSPSPSKSLKIVQSDSPKRTAAPCPRSKKPKLEEVEVETAVQISQDKDAYISNVNETEKSDSEIISVVSLPSASPVGHTSTHEAIQKTESKKLYRPCPRSRKTDFIAKDSKKSNDKSSRSSSSEKSVGNPEDLKTKPTKVRNVVYNSDSHAKVKNDKVKTTTIQIKEMDQKQIHRKVQQITPPPNPEDVLSSTHEILMTAKWKKAISQLQKEIGTPKSLNFITSCFSSKKLLSFQQTLNNSKPQYLFELVLPHIWVDLDLHDLLQCRLVCGRWASAVDKLLSNRPDADGEKTREIDHEIIDFASNRPISAFRHNLFVDQYNRQRFTCQLLSLQKVQSFHEKVKDHPRNPFVTRSVLIRANPELNEAELFNFWMGVKELFHLHGEHIWHLQLDIQGYHSVSSSYKMIQRVINLTPNLRSLELLCHSMTKSAIDLNDTSARKPLPHLLHLQTLDLNGAKCPTSFSGMFIEQYAKTLKNLRVSLYRWSEEDALLIPKLREIHITAMCSRENLPHLFSQLQSLQQLNFLSKLNLTVIVPLLTDKLFGILQHYKSLRTIKIILLEHIGEQINLQDDMSSNTNESPPILPKVNSLELTLTSSQKSFRFLKWFPSLQSLHLTVSQKHAFKDDAAVKTVQDRIGRSIIRCIVKQSAVHSSMWSSLPSLRVLTVALTDLNDKQKDFYFAREMCQNKV